MDRKNRIIINSLFYFLLIIPVGAQKSSHDSLIWELDYRVVEKKAKKENKLIVVFFTGSDWCGACKLLLDNYFNKRKFLKLSKNFVLYEADFPKNKIFATKIQEKYNLKLKSTFDITAFPTVIIIDYKGNLKGKIIGYKGDKTSKIYSSFFKKALNNKN